MSASSLSALSLDAVSRRLKGFGSSLEGKNFDAISALLEALESGLNETLADGYHLSAIDPGIGKTLSVATFLQTWKEQGFNPSSSVLIGLSRLEEIDSYMRSSGLTKADVAVLTSDPVRNDLGVPEDQHSSARVMFTTHQMIERRTRGRTFAAAKELHFQGRPRALRIWDESFMPAEGLSLRADTLVGLLAPLRHICPEYASELQALISDLWATASGHQIAIPKALSELPSAARKAIKLRGLIEKTEALERLAGSTATAIDTGNGDIHLAGASPPIPPDFAPVIILDASGRVRSTYDVWKKSGAPLHRLPCAAKDYRNLTIHLWERGIGKEPFKNPSTRAEVAEAVAGAIRDDMTSSWLIISYKEPPIEDQVRKALNGAEPEGGLHFLTWGMHHGTNAYAGCENVVLIGQMTYGTAGYSALAASLGAETDEAELSLRAGEYQHHWLQALTRASVRRSRGSIAETCTAHVIAIPRRSAGKLLAETFPGCTLETWTPDLAPIKGQAGELIKLLKEARLAGKVTVAKKEFRDALGIDQANLGRLWKQPAVLACLADEGALMEHHTVRFVGNSFGPYVGDEYDEDGFVYDELESLSADGN